MAMDTASERQSSSQMLLWSLLSLPLPSGVMATQPRRQHIAHTYAGILAAVLGAATYTRLERGIRGLHRGLARVGQ